MMAHTTGRATRAYGGRDSNSLSCSASLAALAAFLVSGVVLLGIVFSDLSTVDSVWLDDALLVKRSQVTLFAYYLSRRLELVRRNYFV